MKKTKVLSGMLAGCMLMSALTGCGGGSSADSGSTPSASGGDAAGTPTGTVRIMSNVTGGKDDAEMKLFSEALSKATGLTIEIEKPASDYNKVLMQKLQGGEEYDLIYCGANEYVQLIDQGALLDITDRVKNSEILSNNIDPQEWADITVDGKVYAGFNKKEVHRVVQLNRQMLEAAGIDYTKIQPTLDGYYKVFKALKENNTTKDFYPFNCVLSESYDLQPWFASAGLSNGMREVNGKKTCAYATEEAIPVWEWFKKLYDEGLLDPSSFVDQTKDMRAKMEASSLKTAVCVDWAAWLGLHNSNALAGGVSQDQYEIVSLPGTQTPDGSYKLVKGSASLFAVPANAKNVDGAIKVLEYFATQEGGELLSIGMEGNDYTKDGSAYTQTETGKAHGNDHGAPVPIFKDFVNPLGYNPGVEEALALGQYASVDPSLADEDTYKKTVGKWGIKMVKGEVSAADGVKGLSDELATLGFTDK